MQLVVSLPRHTRMIIHVGTRLVQICIQSAAVRKGSGFTAVPAPFALQNHR